MFQCLSLDLGSWLFYISPSTLSFFKIAFLFSIIHSYLIDYKNECIGTFIFKICIILMMYICVYLCVSMCTWVWCPWRPKEGIGYPKEESGNWKAVDVGVRHWACLCKSSTCSYLLNYHLALTFRSCIKYKM